MKWKLLSGEGKWRDLGRVILLFGIPGLVVWLGNNAIGHINELYEGLCPTQGAGMATHLYENDPQGYCTGIGSDLDILEYIMWLAAIAVMVTFVMWWQHDSRA